MKLHRRKRIDIMNLLFYFMKLQKKMMIDDRKL